MSREADVHAGMDSCVYAHFTSEANEEMRSIFESAQKIRVK